MYEILSSPALAPITRLASLVIVGAVLFLICRKGVKDYKAKGLKGIIDEILLAVVVIILYTLCFINPDVLKVIEELIVKLFKYIAEWIGKALSYIFG